MYDTGKLLSFYFLLIFQCKKGSPNSFVLKLFATVEQLSHCLILYLIVKCVFSTGAARHPNAKTTGLFFVSIPAQHRFLLLLTFIPFNPYDIMPLSLCIFGM